MRIMTLRVPDDVRETLMTYAKEHGLTRNGLVLQILWDWIEELKRKEKAG